MTKLMFTLGLILLTLASFAGPKKEVLTLPGKEGALATNRVAYIEYTKPSENKLPVLLLGPGVNRGILGVDRMVSALLKRGYGYVALHFSTLPHSVAALGKDKTPFFDEEEFEMKDYAEEMESVGRWAEKEFGREVIPVTLSFSGAPSSLLKGFKRIIDLAPMVSLKHGKPTLYYYYNNLRVANMFNPFGSAVIRAAMDQTYLPIWRPKAQQMVNGYNFDSELEDKILEGYMTSSRSLEGFEWEAKNTPDNTLRVFVFAEEEGESLLKGQVEVLKEFFKKNKKTGCFFVRGAEHAISFSHPVTTAKIIDRVVKGSNKTEKGCYDVQSTNDFRFVEEDQIDSLFP